MDKRYFILAHETARKRAYAALRDAPEGYQVTIEPPKRSGAQNRIFHALCGDIARSGIEWAGKKRNSDEWKVLLISGHGVATKEAGEVVPGLESEFVSIRESSARMSKRRANSLIEYTLAFCAARGIETGDYLIEDQHDRPEAQ
jgi:hypothetical protein